MAPLLTLVKDGRADKVAALLGREPELIGCTKLLSQHSAFHVAAKHDRPNVLLSLGARVDALLAEATRSDQCAAVVRRLSRSGNLREVLLNRQDRRGRTPLHLACERGSTEAVKALLGMGADLWVRDRWDRTALHLAIGRGNVACAEEVIAAALTSTVHPLKRWAWPGAHGEAVLRICCSGAAEW
jgi:hypothetical protein